MVVSRRTWRFSLRALLIALTFVLIAISHLKTTLDLRAVRSTTSRQAAELQRLREEVGLFEIEDRANPHVLFLPQKEPDAYRWRVYLPPRRQDYEICVGAEGIPETGVPTDMYQFQPLRHGEPPSANQRLDETFTIDVFLSRDAAGQYQWHVRHLRGEMFVPADPIAGGGQSHFSVWRERLRVLDPKQPVVLLRGHTRPAAKLPGSQTPPGPVGELIVWIR